MELKPFPRRLLVFFATLLIVPYGIETKYCTRNRSENLLLIVPYGIETLYSQRLECLRRSFNRTLWN